MVTHRNERCEEIPTAESAALGTWARRIPGNRLHAAGTIPKPHFTILTQPSPGAAGSKRRPEVSGPVDAERVSRRARSHAEHGTEMKTLTPALSQKGALHKK